MKDKKGSKKYMSKSLAEKLELAEQEWLKTKTKARLRRKRKGRS